MIVKMKKVQIIALAADKLSTLATIRDLGVMHVVSEKLSESRDRIKLQARIQDIARIQSTLSEMKPLPATTKDAATFKGAEFVAQFIRLLDERNDIVKNMEVIVNKMEQLSHWGDFDSEDLKNFASAGYYIYPCEGLKRDIERCGGIAGVSVEILKQLRGKYLFVVVSPRSLADEDLPLANLPANTSLSRLDNEYCALLTSRDEIDQKLQSLKVYQNEFAAYAKNIVSEVEFLAVRDGMTNVEQLTVITGFVPERECAKLVDCARTSGWAINVEDPGPDDLVPTLLDVKKPARAIMPLFKFLGIEPGYHEFDVSGSVMLFFTIFFGMIIGDAGYGTIFLVLTLILWHAKRDNPAVCKVAKLLTILSCSAIIWGILSGNLFGCSMPGLDMFATSPNKDANVQALCFLLALVQLSMARILQCCAYPQWRKILGNIGWMLLLWGNFLLIWRMIVFPGDFPEIMTYFYAVGFGLILIFDINWKDVGAIFNFPFSAIGTFVDILSYIRLFAVGVSGYYIASSFNGMAAELWPGEWYFAIAIILFGHLLNLSLCIMGVLVHGVRLNTLEFANHTGLTWSGLEFSPFKKQN
ncbi:MAG: hypothetical protein RR060_03980 [Victivallaceae bacterium]